MLRSTAADKATNAAASSVQVTCCDPTSTTGLLTLPSPPTVEDITNPLYISPGHHPVSDPDEVVDDPDPDPVHEAKSKLLFGLPAGEVPVVMSMVNFPPGRVGTEAWVRVIPAEPITPASGRSSKRYPSPSELESRHASSRPQGFQVPSPGRRMSQAPGLDRLTRSDPCEGTNGVTIEAAATGDPERS